jgi:hypothetical protein
MLAVLSGCAKDTRDTLISDLRQDIAPRGSIYGQIRNASNGPVPLANIIAEGHGYSAISGADGSFILDELPEDSYTLCIVRTGYKDTIVKDVVLALAETRDMGFVHVLSALSTVSGRVIDTTGHPVDGATVGIPDYQFTTVTGSDGCFNLENVPAGYARIIACAGEKGWGMSDLEYSAGENAGVDITLISEGGTAAGTVYDENENPASGVVVICMGIGGASLSGGFQLSHLPSSVPLVISAGTGREVRGVLVPEADTLAGIEIHAVTGITNGSLTIYPLQIFALEEDSVVISPDVRLAGGAPALLDSVAVFLWDITSGASAADTTGVYETATSVPYIRVLPPEEHRISYGIITASGDTLAGAEVTFHVRAVESSIVFSEEAFSPEDLAAVNEDSVTLTWHAADGSGRSLSYNVYFGDSDTDPPPIYASGITGSVVRVKPAAGWNRNFYLWQIEAVSSKTGVKSGIYQFTYKH